MQKKNSSLYEKLFYSKLVGEQLSPPSSGSIWYISILQAFSGWMAALFFVLFIWATFWRVIDDSPTALLIIGILPILLAYKMLRSEQSELWEHFAIAISLTGQVMVIVAVSMLFDYKGEESLSLFVALFQTLLVWKMPNYIHRLLSSLFTSAALAYFFYFISEPSIYLIILNVLTVWLWLHQFTLGADIKQTEAISYAALISLLILKITTLYGGVTAQIGVHVADYFIPNSVAEVASGVILFYLVWRLLKREYQATNQTVILLALGGVVVFSLLSMKAIGLTTAITIIILGFATSHRLLFGLGVISLLFFISNYYYFTGVTLLDKAYILAIVGVALLLARWLTTQLLGAIPKEDNDA